jgi:histone acetyltransferase (RNA polymerase elongator complex component)
MNFCNKKGIKLNNASVYEKLFSLLTPNIEICHIQGHIPKNQMNTNNLQFSELDQYVRSKLRQTVDSCS